MEKSKVLVADPISPKGVELLKQKGFDVVEAYGSTPDQVKELVKDADAVIVRSETKITADVLACAKKLKAVGRAGVGVDNIDIPAASEKGVVVMNTPTGNTIATAELTFTHMLCGTRPIAQANASIHSGVWDRKSFKGTELKNKVLAVLGMGRIGTEVAKRAMAFGMKVVAYDPFLTEARAKTLGVEIVPLEDAFKRADYITVHMPLTDATKYMVDEKAFEMMKKGVMDEIKTIFKPEFLNRIDDIIVFHPLEQEEITRIVRLLTDVMAKRVKENMNITVSFTKKAIEKIAEEGYDKAYGARPLRRAIQSKIEDAFAEEYLLGNIKAGDKVSVGLKTNGFSFRVVK